MLIETRAVVLHRSAYSDRYSIVHLYTKEYGRLGVLVSTNKSRKNKMLNMLMPLAEVELVGELKLGKSLATLKELRLYNPNYHIQLNPIKCSQGIFLSELLYRLLVHDEADERLYDFISNSMLILHSIERGVANFYMTFCYLLLHYLAIEPTILDSHSSRIGGMWFDLREAQYVQMPSLQSQAIPPHLLPALQTFARINYYNMHVFRYSREDRRQIVDYLLLYYRLHLPTFGVIKSLEVLRGAVGSTQALNT